MYLIYVVSPIFFIHLYKDFGTSEIFVEDLSLVTKYFIYT